MTSFGIRLISIMNYMIHGSSPLGNPNNFGSNRMQNELGIMLEQWDKFYIYSHNNANVINLHKTYFHMLSI